jgi:hypothetical protein
MRDEQRKPMKVVGRRGEAKVNVVTIDSMQRMAGVLRQNRPFLPKGVWRFKSFEEADKWMMDMLTRPGNREFQP